MSPRSEVGAAREGRELRPTQNEQQTRGFATPATNTSERRSETHGARLCCSGGATASRLLDKLV